VSVVSISLDLVSLLLARRSARFDVLVLALSALALGCGSKPPPQAAKSPSPPPVDAGNPDATEDSAPSEDAGDASAPLPPAETAEDVAARWLEALRRADPALLDAWSRYPFSLHDTGDEGTCGQGAAADGKQLSQLLGCILYNEPLLAELRSQPEPEARVVLAKDLPTWARRWRAELAKDAVLVLVEILGHGNATRFVLVVREGGVQAAWKQTMFETK
jgi:hypothetical protein